jgi:hypothetical protein
MVEIIDLKRHAEILRGYHVLTVSFRRTWLVEFRSRRSHARLDLGVRADPRQAKYRRFHSASSRPFLLI